MAKKSIPTLSVTTLTHGEATRKNIPTAEYQSVMKQDEQAPVRIAYARGAAGLDEEKTQRNCDLDPQLVWRGKDQQDWSDLVVNAPPLYIQEKIHPKVLIDDLLRRSAADRQGEEQIDLFADFNGLPDDNARTEFYQHDAHWANRMILGDSLQVMASLAEREGLRGQVQCIYFDPPYGIKFNSNFQWSTTSRDVKDGNTEHITREPEQVKAFRDTWRDGIHSYLTYLRDRLTVARDLLTDSGSIFVQIGDENVHRVRAVMDEVFGEDNSMALISFKKTSSLTSEFLANNFDYIIWFAKNRLTAKYRSVLVEKGYESDLGFYSYTENENGERRKIAQHEQPNPSTAYSVGDLTSSHDYSEGKCDFEFQGKKFKPGTRFWTTSPMGMSRLAKANRIHESTNSVRFVRFFRDYPAQPLASTWVDTITGQYSDPRIYVVQTSTKVVQRCILMATDPGDLVLDPTCGSGTTATVAEQWGRRWITLDTSRVALALARARIMGARYPYYLLADSRDGQIKEAEVTRSASSSHPTHGDLRHGFVYERVPHITLKSIANNAEIDVIWEKWQQTLEPLRAALAVGAAHGRNTDAGRGHGPLLPVWQEWEIPRDADPKWPDAAKKLHADWWQARIARQKEMDASIAAKAEFEYLYDKPYEDKKKVRVAGPFTVESLSPHRVLGVDEDDDLLDGVGEDKGAYGEERDFVRMILENLKTAGVQQAHKEDKITFTSLAPWPGDLICAEGRYDEGGTEKRAGIFIGPEFGTVNKPDLVEAARECAEAGFDVLVACAFNYDVHSSDFSKLGRIPVLKARMNADLHMAEDLKNTGKGNLFVIFGEPDIDILEVEGGQVRVKVNGVDVFHPNTGEVRSDGPEGIACWFIDTDYNMESFFVRQAYFLGANDPYKALKTTLKAEINEEAWATLHSDTSRPFDKPKSGRIAVKVINHLGDEVMKVFRIV
ncbi:site-specific DNA-methyltransferase [Acidithiobacillus sulfuriphilus]|uniref:site-specific DNA-methyltransferase (adenine-specific) n=2 Tax=Acidithiobacillus sulfuriphilus TaxID=1867749 RepID=A0A3M8R600_9PROT|nr:site-specific DNA-methyltransferase [Acidithiobacillus sulfuriphilus]RNF64008.1 site-specific DNA-methyltransferase [Acidithiobacillus sulfuriphilus]